MSESKNGKTSLPPLRVNTEITMEEFNSRMKSIDDQIAELEKIIGTIKFRIEQRGNGKARKPRRDTDM